ncbi:thiol-disulfide isomerase/thioredoxin [Paraburkholderia sp. GAS448]|uniref:redoxin family protein n=1 Tax=Paraburkholderia sp. GAS448 TaxID=3035136 RepID=UPI003D214B95
MNIGPFAFPVRPLIFLLSVAIAMLIAWLFDNQHGRAETAISTSIVVGLIAARILFVLRFLPGYDGSVLRMLDFRDGGFDTFAGLAAGIAMVVFFLVRRKEIRRPLLRATTAGLAAWGAAVAATGAPARLAVVPVVSLPNAEGGQQALAPHDGKPLIVNLWATWCAPCQAEMPVLANAQARYRGVDLVFVNQAEARSTVDTFMTDLNLRVDNSLLDPTLSVARATGVSAYPTTLFYDAAGRLLEMHLGRFSKASFEATMVRLYPASILRLGER